MLRVIVLVLVAAALTGLGAGCGSGPTSQQAPTTEGMKGGPVRRGVSPPPLPPPPPLPGKG